MATDLQSNEVLRETGRGLMAGLAGTIAVSVLDSLEHRSGYPVSRVSRPNDITYGLAWGAVRGALGSLDVPPVQASAMQFVGAFGADLAERGVEDQRDTLRDAVHHLVWTSVNHGVYELLRGDARIRDREGSLAESSLAAQPSTGERLEDSMHVERRPSPPEPTYASRPEVSDLPPPAGSGTSPGISRDV